MLDGETDGRAGLPYHSQGCKANLLSAILYSVLSAYVASAVTLSRVAFYFRL